MFEDTDTNDIWQEKYVGEPRKGRNTKCYENLKKIQVRLEKKAASKLLSILIKGR